MTDRQTIEIKAGLVIRDNDPRTKGREREIIKVEKGRVYYKTASRMASLSLNSVYVDGKSRATGWSVVL